MKSNPQTHVETSERVRVVGPVGSLEVGHREILTSDALGFLGRLVAEFADDFDDAMARREIRRNRWRSGETLNFLAETREIRDAAWSVAPIPEDLKKRVVEITGPVDRKMIVNALNSGADVFMADFEDSSSPTWANMVDGQLHLRDAARRTISLEDTDRGKSYRLGNNLATLVVRPRGLHLREAGCTFGSRDIPASLFDFGLYFFHNARVLLDSGSGPYFYLPKLESHLEARLWNRIFVRAQELLEIPQGSIRATVLIETLPAAFEMDEILWELREHSAGLNCGRWDYIFSFIKVHRDRSDSVLPDRSQVTMDQPCMRAYSQLAVKTCHRRGIHAIGGMAAQIPIKNDPAANEAALNKVRADKRREVNDGHDGTWVAHPGLVGLAREIFEEGMEGPNQIGRSRDDVHPTAEDLLEVPKGTRTEEGLRLNLRVGVQYLQAWIHGNGCVPLYNLMEDAATAEISRAQVWQWLRHGAVLADGRKVDRALVVRFLEEEVSALDGDFSESAEFFTELCFAEEMPEFLTSFAYQKIHS